MGLLKGIPFGISRKGVGGQISSRSTPTTGLLSLAQIRSERNFPGNG